MATTIRLALPPDICQKLASLTREQLAELSEAIGFEVLSIAQVGAREDKPNAFDVSEIRRRMGIK